MSEFKETFYSVNRALSEACKFALKQTLPGKQIVLMSEAMLRLSSCALKIEDKPEQKTQSKR